MRLRQLVASRYSSLRDVTLPIKDLNVLIGVNASGKSAILDSLRFLKEGVHEGDFSSPVRRRGNLVHLAWKGQAAFQMTLETRFSGDIDGELRWVVKFEKRGFDFVVLEERVNRYAPGGPPSELLRVNEGQGSWWSGNKQEGVPVNVAPTTCTLAKAAADDSFPARQIADVIKKWSFFDPVPELIRRGTAVFEGDTLGLDRFGRGLPVILYELKENAPSAFDRVLSATRAVLGMPEKLEVRKDEEEERFYFVQYEKGLSFPVHQLGASAGTLRVLALMTALYGGKESATLVAIEEPENYVHPAALQVLAENIREASPATQIIITTHSPLLLNYFSPEDVFVVKRSENGTVVNPEQHPDAVRKALEESGFGLGAFHDTKGFGG